MFKKIYYIIPHLVLSLTTLPYLYELINRKLDIVMFSLVKIFQLIYYLITDLLVGNTYWKGMEIKSIECIFALPWFIFSFMSLINSQNKFLFHISQIMIFSVVPMKLTHKRKPNYKDELCYNSAGFCIGTLFSIPMYKLFNWTGIILISIFIWIIRIIFGLYDDYQIMYKNNIIDNYKNTIKIKYIGNKAILEKKTEEILIHTNIDWKSYIYGYIYIIHKTIIHTIYITLSLIIIKEYTYVSPIILGTINGLLRMANHSMSYKKANFKVDRYFIMIFFYSILILVSLFLSYLINEVFVMIYFTLFTTSISSVMLKTSLDRCIKSIYYNVENHSKVLRKYYNRLGLTFSYFIGCIAIQMYSRYGTRSIMIILIILLLLSYGILTYSIKKHFFEKKIKFKTVYYINRIQKKWKKNKIKRNIKISDCTDIIIHPMYN